MMMTHRIVLKTHPLLATHVRSVHSILFSSGLQTTKRPEAPRRAPRRESVPRKCVTLTAQRLPFSIEPQRDSSRFLPAA